MKYINILKTIRDKYSLTDDISVMNVAKFPDIIKTEEKEEDEDEKKNFAKEQLKEITLRFKLTEEEYRLLLREKAKIVVQIPSSTKHKTSNRVINKKAY